MGKSYKKEAIKRERGSKKNDYSRKDRRKFKRINLDDEIYNIKGKK